MSEIREEDIAIIGMAGRFPGAETIDQFWKNLCAGLESTQKFNDAELMCAGIDSALFSRPDYVRVKGVVNKVEYFDPDFYGMSALEAQMLDPQHRIFLMCAYEALENAGFAPRQSRERVGVFASTGMSFYLIKNILSNAEFIKHADEYQLFLANDKDFLATRVSYLLNLTGPSVNIQTGCSSSLACVHYACQSLLSGECDVALAGGVSITIPQEQGYLYKKEMIGSPDGRCYAFDERAQGTIKSNGAGVVVLKPLSDALRDNCHIYAVIRGTAINNDGANKVGYTAPSVSQQCAVIKEALRMAEVSPDSIEYIETHGTGTLLGDPIEIAALKQAYAGRHYAPQSCALASLKTNIGHLDIAAGVAGLIKVALAVYHEKIPASLNFSKLNPKINFSDTPFYVNTELKSWSSQHRYRRAGVSAFGVGGTNVHVVLQQAPVKSIAEISQNNTKSYLFSAKHARSLESNVHNIARFLRENPSVELSDVAYTLQNGREWLPYRMAVTATDYHDLVGKLEQFRSNEVSAVKQNRAVVFMFSGQGSQYPGMARHLYQQEREFRLALDECILALKPYVAHDLYALIFPNHALDDDAEYRLKQTEVTQPALFAIEYALAKCFMAYGVKPAAVVGHSIGEYVAAVVAGIFTLEDAAKLIAIRGKLIQRLPPGSMLAIFADKQKVSAMLPKKIDIALVNAPGMTVVSGPAPDIEKLMRELNSSNTRHQLIQTSHAFHSSMLDPVLEEFGSVVAGIRRAAPQLPIAGNYTGTWLQAEETQSIHYWVNQLRHTVQFVDCIAAVQQRYSPVFLEIGPGRTLQSLVMQQGILSAINSLPQAHEAGDDMLSFHSALALLWSNGVQINWADKGSCIPLPTYSWNLQRCWIDPPQAIHQQQEPVIARTDLSSSTLIKEAWQKVLGVVPASNDDNFFALGGNSLAAIQLIHHLPGELQARINVVHVYQFPKLGQMIAFVESLSHVKNNDNHKNINESHAELELFSAQGEL